MHKLIIALVGLVLLPSIAAASKTAFFKYEIAPQGSMTKTCVYDFLGSEYSKTVKSYQLCPLTLVIEDDE